MRRRLAQTHLRGLACVVEFSRAVGDLGQTIRLLEETIRLAPYKESAYRDLMRAHTDSGDRAAAIEVYDDLRALLAAELDAERAMTTAALLREVLAHQ